MALGPLLGRFWTPRWAQVGSKIDAKSMKNGYRNRSKFCMLFEWPFSGSWRPTWPQKPPKTVPGGGEIAPVFGLGGVLGASWRLLGSKTFQKLIFGLNLTEFDPNFASRCAILGPRWAHCGGMLGHNGTQHSLQTSQEMTCS